MVHLEILDQRRWRTSLIWTPLPLSGSLSHVFKVLSPIAKKSQKYGGFTPNFKSTYWYVFCACFDATIKIAAKGYVNNKLIKVSALTAVQLFSSNESISPRPPEPRRLPRSWSSLHSRCRRRRPQCALKE